MDHLGFIKLTDLLESISSLKIDVTSTLDLGPKIDRLLMDLFKWFWDDAHFDLVSMFVSFYFIACLPRCHHKTLVLLLDSLFLRILALHVLFLFQPQRELL